MSMLKPHFDCVMEFYLYGESLATEGGRTKPTPYAITREQGYKEKL